MNMRIDDLIWQERFALMWLAYVGCSIGQARRQPHER
jgi:hypothetical protein